ncbi:hypothetical protein ACPV5O_20760 [Vibrio maritimus]|uniref:ParM/StbA family protein n=1 Tax=Vibrio maritimus TaxID=990268 RepID=UPI004067AF4D
MSSKKELTSAAIDIGFGTCAVTTNLHHRVPFYIDYPSRIVRINKLTHSSTDAAMWKGKSTSEASVIVHVNGTDYEVGPNVSSQAADGVRALHSDFVSSERYLALYKGALGLQPNDCLDFLVVGLPLDALIKAKEVRDLMSGVHFIGSRKINVKHVKVFAQPLGALLWHAKKTADKENPREDIMHFLNGVPKRAVLDQGYGTFDCLTVSGLVPDKPQSGAAQIGHNKTLAAVSLHLTNSFNANVSAEHVDQAFRTGELHVFGRSYSFPTCESFDVLPIIRAHVNDCIEFTKNKVGSAVDIAEFLLAGGPAPYFLEPMKKAFPHHRIILVEDHASAVVRGFGEIARQWRSSQNAERTHDEPA